MHLIIDIRQKISDPMITRYALAWTQSWCDRHPWDTVTYLALDGQDTPNNISTLRIPQQQSWRTKKSIATKGTREIFRCVNFSRFAPYDPQINTISHIYDALDFLYPKDENIWQQYRKTQIQKSLIRTSKHIIVPHDTIANELVETLQTHESKYVTIPYISISPEKNTPFLQELGINTPYWIYDGQYGSEVDMSSLLSWYKQYQENGGTHMLVLMWDPWWELKNLTNLIRAMNIANHVKFIWMPLWSLIDAIYTYASGWIYTGNYYAGNARVELARSYGLPLLLSDIAVFDGYESLRVHPHHLQSLATKLLSFEKQKSPTYENNNDAIMKTYERLIAET